MFQLRGIVKNYEWGHQGAIAEIQGRQPSGLPEAEYWLGAHPAAPSIAIVDDRENGDGSERGLDDLVSSDPIGLLGDAAADRFGGLPFLLKILAADRPLSIQAHPNSDQALAGFAREEDAGIDRSAPNRNYRDPNHKPELICAITPFEAKCGFRSLDATRRLIGHLVGVAAVSDESGLADLQRRLALPDDDDIVVADVLAWLLGLTSEVAASLVADVVARASKLVPAEDGVAAAEFAAELTWTARIEDAFPGDIGVVVSLLLNHVTLDPGQAVFLGAGNMHAYLSGVGIELMASSDNVLRGGLTSKWIDIDELLSIVSSTPIDPPIQTATESVHLFESPVPEFSLTRLAAGADGVEASFEPQGPEIVLVTSGEASIVADLAGDRCRLSQGDAVFVSPADGRYRLLLEPGSTLAWRASLGR